MSRLAVLGEVREPCSRTLAVTLHFPPPMPRLSLSAFRFSAGLELRVFRRGASHGTSECSQVSATIVPLLRTPPNRTNLPLLLS